MYFLKIIFVFVLETIQRQPVSRKIKSSTSHSFPFPRAKTPQSPIRHENMLYNGTLPGLSLLYITGVLPCNGNYLLQWLHSSFTAVHQDLPVGHTLEQTVEWSHDTLPPWLTEMEVVLPHISFAPNNNIALMALIWRRHPSFVPYWVGYHWLAVRGWSGGSSAVLVTPGGIKAVTWHPGPPPLPVPLPIHHQTLSSPPPSPS